MEALIRKSRTFIEGDICSQKVLHEIFSLDDISSVVHFAEVEAVDESVEKPLDYLSVNVVGTITRRQSIQTAGVFNLVFSSSGTV